MLIRKYSCGLDVYDMTWEGYQDALLHIYQIVSWERGERVLGITDEVNDVPAKTDLSKMTPAEMIQYVKANPTAMKDIMDKPQQPRTKEEANNLLKLLVGDNEKIKNMAGIKFNAFTQGAAV